MEETKQIYALRGKQRVIKVSKLQVAALHAKTARKIHSLEVRDKQVLDSGIYWNDYFIREPNKRKAWYKMASALRRTRCIQQIEPFRTLMSYEPGRMDDYTQQKIKFGMFGRSSTTPLNVAVGKCDIGTYSPSRAWRTLRRS